MYPFYLDKIPFKLRRPSIILSDFLITVVSFYLSFFLRFEGSIPPQFLAMVWHCLPIVVSIRMLFFYCAGLYKGIWRYASIYDMMAIFRAVSIGSGAIVVVFFILFGLQGYPRSIFIIDWLLEVMLIGGSRFIIRSLRAIAPGTFPVKRVLVVGAGDAGEMLIREMVVNHKLNYKAAGLVDDDPGKSGKMIHGVKVLGTLQEIGKILVKYGIDEVFIAIPSASGKIIKDLMEQCQEARVKFRRVPAMREMIDGKITVQQMRELQFEDLLCRDAITLDLQQIGSFVKNKSVMITGAAGSIGSELCRQIANFNPRNFILLDHAENNLFRLMLELNEKNLTFEIVPIIGDITDKSHINTLFQEFRPQVVFHAAAHKHVPMMEYNKARAVKNNVEGTKVIAEAAHRYNTEKFIMISTDKAVNPTSTMGVSKRIAELIVQGFKHTSTTKFITVRFGNVLGSDGSVVPLFQRQIARGGPVTVTHPEIKRYFMTIPEAVQLVLQAAAMGQGGEIYVLNMGEPVKILDLARNLIILSGYKPGEDIEIVFTGLRAGEKLYEDLWIKEEKVVPTAHDKIMVANAIANDRAKLNGHIDQLLKMVFSSSEQELMLKLKEIVPAYNPGGDIQHVIQRARKIKEN